MGWYSTVLNRTGLITFFGLYRNETIWFGCKFRNDLVHIGISFKPKLSPGLFLNLEFLVDFTLSKSESAKFRWLTSVKYITDYNQRKYADGLVKFNWFTTLAKVSDWYSFRANQNYSNSVLYLYPSPCESFRTNPKFSESSRNLYTNQIVSFRSNPKNVINPVWFKTVVDQSNSIRFILIQPKMLIWTKFLIQINQGNPN